MRVAVQRHRPGIVGDFMDALAHTVHELGHEVTRTWRATASERLPRHRLERAVPSLPQPTFYCEHGWLPRWHYQVSAMGSMQTLTWRRFSGTAAPLGVEAGELEDLATIRCGGPPEYRYMRPPSRRSTDVPEAFILIPLQIEWTLTFSGTSAEPASDAAFIDYVSAAEPLYPLIIKQHPADVRRGNASAAIEVAALTGSALAARCWQCSSDPADRPLQLHRLAQQQRGPRRLGLGCSCDRARQQHLAQAQPGPFMTALPKDWSEIESFFRREHATMPRGLRQLPDAGPMDVWPTRADPQGREPSNKLSRRRAPAPSRPPRGRPMAARKS